MAEMTKNVLEKTIKRYIKVKDYKTAKNYVENYADKFKDFDKEKALEEIEQAEKGIKKPKITEKEE